MNIPDNTVKDILQQLPKAQRQTVLNTLNGKNTHRVYCNSGKKGQCKNRFVGYIQTVNDETKFEPVVNEAGEMHVRSWRPRMDGQMGFLCWCGNDTRISKHEEGEFDYKGNIPNKAGFNRIFERLQLNPPNYAEKNGIKNIDGFLVEAIA